jgi:hypothetical protein
VSVPVLSMQIVSTAASASVAAICWTSTRRFASRTAATAKVTLASSTRPSGISVIRPAVAVCAPSRKSVSRRISVPIRRIANGTSRIVVAQRIRLISSWSGDGGWRNSRASPASFSA